MGRARRATLVLVLAMLCATAGLAASRDQEFASGPAPKEFRGLAFGAPRSGIADLVPVPDQPQSKIVAYFRTSEPLFFGPASIVSVAYYFRNDRLFGVGVAFQGQDNYFLVREELERLYGKGRSLAGRQGWVWPAFSLELRFDSDRKQGEVRYTQEAEPPKEGPRTPPEPRSLPVIPSR